MTRVVVATSDWASWPDFGGATWVPIQYLLGLLQLGVEAIWIDHLARPTHRRRRESAEVLVGRFAATARDFGFADRWSVRDDDGPRHHGLPHEAIEAWARDADLLLRLSGRALPEDSPLLRIARRAYVDLDPGFTQGWARHIDMGFGQFNRFFTVGLGVGRPGFALPTDGIDWQPTLPPIVLDLWPPAFDPPSTGLTTVADWWGQQYVEIDGVRHGGKRAEFLRFIRVPLEAGQTVEVAMDMGAVHPAERALLARNGWIARDPSRCAGDPQAYRKFIRRSRGEFSVAKAGYVRSGSGWVSDRSACYLASGKPAIVQSTGFEADLPTGQGLLTFRTPDEAVAAIRAIDDDYPGHTAAARALAEARFESGRVLGSLLERALA